MGSRARTRSLTAMSAENDSGDVVRLGRPAGLRLTLGTGDAPNSRPCVLSSRLALADRRGQISHMTRASDVADEGACQAPDHPSADSPAFQTTRTVRLLRGPPQHRASTPAPGPRKWPERFRSSPANNSRSPRPRTTSATRAIAETALCRRVRDCGSPFLVHATETFSGMQTLTEQLDTRGCLVRMSRPHQTATM